MAVLGFHGQAAAQTLIDEKIIQLDFGPPGHLTIDASPGTSLVPLHDQDLAFPSWEDYLEFLGRVFNVEMAEIGNTKVPHLSLTILGEPMTLTPNLDGVQQEDDPIGAFVGGLSGIVEVAGVEYCVNANRCADAVSPLTLQAVQTTVGGDALVGPSAHAASYGPFSISSSLHMNTMASIYGPETLVREYRSDVFQVSGSFGYSVFFLSEPEVVCVDVDGSMADQQFSNKTCFLSAGNLLGSVQGSNQLWTEIQLSGVQPEKGQCVYGTEQIGPKTGRDVMRVTLRHTAVKSNGTYWPNQRSFQPEHVLGFSRGQDNVQGDVDWDRRQIVTGLNPPCRKSDVRAVRVPARAVHFSLEHEMRTSAQRTIPGVALLIAMLFCGCGGEGDSLPEEGTEPRAPFEFSLVTATADITGPIHFIAQSEGVTLHEGILDGSEVGGCAGQNRLGSWVEDVEIVAWSDTALQWEVELRLVEGECHEEAIEFSTTETRMLAFAVGEESFLPVRVYLEDKHVGVVTKSMSLEVADEWLNQRHSIQHPDDFRAFRTWFIEPIRAGQVVWVAVPEPGIYRYTLLYSDGRNFQKLTSVDPDWDTQIRFTHKSKGMFE